METTVTGLFVDADQARQARKALEREGFGADSITVLSRETENLHQLLAEETSDAARGAMLGAAVGGVGAAIAGAAMSVPPVSLFEMHWLIAAIAGGGVGAISGGLIGLLIGSATGHQVQEEYEHLIERGGLVLAVNTDGAHASKAHDLLEKLGAQSLSTAVHAKHHQHGATA